MVIRKSSSSGIPFGNTAGRPASPGTGQLYSNGQLGRLELYTETGWQNIVQETPGVASVSGTYNESAGSGTFTISGTNFVSGGIVYAVGTNGVEYQATTSTTNSIVQMTALFTGLSVAYEPYDIKVLNPSNLFGLLPDAFYINDSPVWSTTAGSLGTYTGSSIQLAATDDESNTITYTVASGSLPTGLSLSSSGLISGTATAVGTYTFTVSASDGINTAVTRSFSVVVPTPVVSGGVLSSDSTYYYRTFTGSSNFVVSVNGLSADYLVIAGGGAGGGAGSNDAGTAGGGGAGGYISASNTAFNTGSYTVTIGSGGAGGQSSNSTYWNNGVNSSIIGGSISVTSTGGGRGDFASGSGGGTGGSGGGSSAGRSGGSRTSSPIQGNNGGSAISDASGGGGGAGTAGGNGGSGSGAGGSGSNAHSSWLSAIASQMSGVSGWSTATSGGYIAGGGGGGGGNGYSLGAGGSGGGTAGGQYGQTGNPNSSSATQNTGSGSGASGTSGNTITGNGGSGIVIFRYTKASVGG
jgi:hypothetical protein